MICIVLEMKANIVKAVSTYVLTCSVCSDCRTFLVSYDSEVRKSICKVLRKQLA